MGHLVFLVLHAIAILFGVVLLFVTVPLHLIYAATRRSAKRGPPEPSARTHNRCPACQEFVLKGANVCRFCGTKLIPYAR